MIHNILKSLLLFFTFLSFNTYGQNVEVVKTNESANKAINPEAFSFIDKAYEMPQEYYVASLNGEVTNSEKSILSNLFNSFWKTANNLGANAYKVNSVEYINDTISIEISIYNLINSEYDEMVKLYPTNMVYVIGDIDKNQKPKKIKFNNKKIILQPMKYIAYQNQIDEKATLSVGGFLGAKVWIKGTEKRLPKHLSLSGFGVGPGNFNSLSISFSTGSIHPVDLSFGQFLINVLKPQ